MNTINVDDCPLPSSDDLRRQGLWLINTVRTFKASAETDDPQAVDLWATTSGLLDGVTTMSPEDLVTLLFARSCMATLLLVRFAELAAEQANVPIAELFDQMQLGIQDAQLVPPGWAGDSADPAS